MDNAKVLNDKQKHQRNSSLKFLQNPMVWKYLIKKRIVYTYDPSLFKRAPITVTDETDRNIKEHFKTLKTEHGLRNFEQLMEYFQSEYKKMVNSELVWKTKMILSKQFKENKGLRQRFEKAGWINDDSNDMSFEINLDRAARILLDKGLNPKHYNVNLQSFLP